MARVVPLFNYQSVSLLFLSSPHSSYSSSQTPADSQPHHTVWSQALRTLQPWRGWCSFAPVGVVWFLCQVEAPLHPYALLVDLCWWFLLVPLLWVTLGACVYALKYCLRPGPDQVSAAAWTWSPLTLLVLFIYRLCFHSRRSPYRRYSRMPWVKTGMVSIAGKILFSHTFIWPHLPLTSLDAKGILAPAYIRPFFASSELQFAH